MGGLVRVDTTYFFSLCCTHTHIFSLCCTHTHTHTQNRYNRSIQEKIHLDRDTKYAILTDYAWMKILSRDVKKSNQKEGESNQNEETKEIWWPVMIFSFSDAATKEREKEKSGMRYLKRVGLDGEVLSWVKISTEKDSLNSLRPFCFHSDTVKQVRQKLYGKDVDAFNTHYMDHVGNLGTYVFVFVHLL